MKYGLITTGMYKGLVVETVDFAKGNRALDGSFTEQADGVMVNFKGKLEPIPFTDIETNPDRIIEYCLQREKKLIDVLTRTLNDLETIFPDSEEVKEHRRKAAQVAFGE